LAVAIGLAKNERAYEKLKTTVGSKFAVWNSRTSCGRKKRIHEGRLEKV
jgi:hypothetical protein